MSHMPMKIKINKQTLWKETVSLVVGLHGIDQRLSLFFSPNLRALLYFHMSDRGYNGQFKPCVQHVTHFPLNLTKNPNGGN